MGSYGFCPHCKSENIEPRGKMYHCNDCGEDFEQAFFRYEPQPDEPKKGEKPNGNTE